MGWGWGWDRNQFAVLRVLLFDHFGMSVPPVEPGHSQSPVLPQLSHEYMNPLGSIGTQ